PSSHHRAISRAGPPCRLASSLRVMTGSSRPSSSGAWHASVWVSPLTRYPAGIWSHSVNRMNSPHGWWRTLLGRAPPSERLHPRVRRVPFGFMRNLLTIRVVYVLTIGMVNSGGRIWISERRSVRRNWRSGTYSVVVLFYAGAGDYSLDVSAGSNKPLSEEK